MRSYMPGIGMFDWDSSVPVIFSDKYYHTNMIGTTRFMSNSSGSKILASKYTAFGERVGGTNHRFGYAGAWGYQTDSSGDVPFTHVGG